MATAGKVFQRAFDTMFSHGICADCVGEQRHIFREKAGSHQDITNSP